MWRGERRCHPVCTMVSCRPLKLLPPGTPLRYKLIDRGREESRGMAGKGQVDHSECGEQRRRLVGKPEGARCHSMPRANVSQRLHHLSSDLSRLPPRPARLPMQTLADSHSRVPASSSCSAPFATERCALRPLLTPAIRQVDPPSPSPLGTPSWPSPLPAPASMRIAVHALSGLLRHWYVFQPLYITNLAGTEGRGPVPLDAPSSLSAPFNRPGGMTPRPSHLTRSPVSPSQFIAVKNTAKTFPFTTGRFRVR